MRSEELPVKPVLVRELIGESLREERVSQGKTLREVSRNARVSLGYLSEVERGQKEASSELLGAICTALDVPMSEVLRDVSDAMAGVELGLPYRPASHVEPVAVGELAPTPLPVTDVAA